MAYEYRIAYGCSIEELEASVNKIAEIREKEMNQPNLDSYDIDAWHFKPVGPINSVSGLAPFFFVLMGRTKPRREE